MVGEQRGLGGQVESESAAIARVALAFDLEDVALDGVFGAARHVGKFAAGAQQLGAAAVGDAEQVAHDQPRRNRTTGKSAAPHTARCKTQ